MILPLRRLLLPALLAVALVLPAAVPAAATEGPSDLGPAETATLKALNAERTKRGLVALRVDTRLMAIAGERSAHQAATQKMSHTHAGGKSVFDLISAAGITWYGAGEIIAWNTWPDPVDSGAAAISGWLGSSSHRAIMLSTSYNYIGLRVALDADGAKYWTGIVMKGPDRTQPWAKNGTQSRQTVDATRVRMTMRWSGNDTRLQVLTSGLRYFEAQRRSAGGTWRSYGTTTNTYVRAVWTRGRTYEFRVRARDRAGNWGSWHTVTIKT